MRLPRNVIFDLGGVLLDWNPARIMETFCSDPTRREEIRAALFRHADWPAFNRGALSETQFKESFSARSGLSIEEIGRLLGIVRQTLVPKEETVELLDSLHEQGVPLYCLTDMPSSVFEYVHRQYAFLKRFKGTVVSGDVGLLKPDAAIFALLLSRFGLRPGDTVFIDDHPPNIEGAKGMGLHTIRFVTAAQCRAELERLPLMRAP
jgi:putative hydrolase of the HAD superfamily